MLADNQSIGIMEGAFFVAKGQIMDWINGLLKINITRIEQLGTGAVYCQILDVMNPGKVAMQRVNFKAVNQWQFINNLKILQQGFSKSKILKYIDIEKLSKCKYQDNLQFIQWMKRYFELYNKTDVNTYDAQVARKNCEVDFSFIQFRNPLKKQKKAKQQEQQPYVRGKSKSPYANVKSKINNRSITVGKSTKNNSNFYLNKLNEIRKIIQNKKSDDKLGQIQQIIKQIQQDIANQNQDQGEQTKNISSVVSKKVITPPKKKLKTLVN